MEWQVAIVRLCTMAVPLAALDDMAQPGVAEARVPCPLCGGLIHPVAGRCKHCKQDLTATRAGRPAAATALPALQNVAAVVVPVTDTPSQPILPPRPTGRSVAAQPHPQSSRWPIYVIVLAVVAIAGAVVIMVWPQHDAAAEHTLQPPPAPERMDTDPMPAPGTADPWGANNAPHSQVVPRSTPDPLPPQPPQQPDDDQFGFGGLVGGNGAANGGGSPDFMLAALGHACKKLKACPNADDTLDTLCDTYMAFPQTGAPTTCATGQKCLDAIDNMSCSQTAASPLSVVQMFQDCTKALTSC
jgi:hypothetical protein